MLFRKELAALVDAQPCLHIDHIVFLELTKMKTTVHRIIGNLALQRFINIIQYLLNNDKYDALFILELQFSTALPISFPSDSKYLPSIVFLLKHLGPIRKYKNTIIEMLHYCGIILTA